MPRNVSLQTERLLIREFREDDWQSVHSYAADPLVTRLTLFGPNTEEDSRNFVHVVMAQQQEMPRRCYDLALTLKAGGRLIGACSLRMRDAEGKIAEMGYCLHRDFWGQGYMPEAAGAMLGFGFETLGLHRIWATCAVENTGSARVMEKIGMLREGIMRDFRVIKGKWRDSYLYAILEDDWRGWNG